MIVQPALPT